MSYPIMFKHLIKYTSPKHKCLCWVSLRKVDGNYYLFATNGYMAIAIDVGDDIKGNTSDDIVLMGNGLLDFIYFADSPPFLDISLADRVNCALVKIGGYAFPTRSDVGFPKLEELMELDKAKWPTGALKDNFNFTYLMRAKPFLVLPYSTIGLRQDDSRSPIYVTGLAPEVTIIIMPVVGGAGSQDDGGMR